MWLCTVCKFTAVSETNEKGASSDFIAIESYFSVSVYRRVKSNSDTLRIHIEIVVLETPLAVIVMDTFD